MPRQQHIAIRQQGKAEHLLLINAAEGPLPKDPPIRSQAQHPEVGVLLIFAKGRRDGSHQVTSLPVHQRFDHTFVVIPAPAVFPRAAVRPGPAHLSLGGQFQHPVVRLTRAKGGRSTGHQEIALGGDVHRPRLLILRPTVGLLPLDVPCGIQLHHPDILTARAEGCRVSHGGESTIRHGMDIEQAFIARPAVSLLPKDVPLPVQPHHPGFACRIPKGIAGAGNHHPPVG